MLMYIINTSHDCSRFSYQPENALVYKDIHDPRDPAQNSV
jgi:hypothetical protein